MANKRNIVVILVDQLRPDFIEPYGADFVKTPNLKALAENGVTFDYAVAGSTVCAPSRASVLTGELVSGHGCWTNLEPTEFNPGIEFLPERLTEAGYMTAAVGVSDHVRPGRTLGYQYSNIFSGKKDGAYMRMLREKFP